MTSDDLVSHPLYSKCTDKEQHFLELYRQGWRPKAAVHEAFGNGVHYLAVWSKLKKGSFTGYLIECIDFDSPLPDKNYLIRRMKRVADTATNSKDVIRACEILSDLIEAGVQTPNPIDPVKQRADESKERLKARLGIGPAQGDTSNAE